MPSISSWGERNSCMVESNAETQTSFHITTLRISQFQWIVVEIELEVVIHAKKKAELNWSSLKVSRENTEIWRVRCQQPTICIWEFGDIIYICFLYMTFQVKGGSFSDYKWNSDHVLVIMCWFWRKVRGQYPKKHTPICAVQQITGIDAKINIVMVTTTSNKTLQKSKLAVRQFSKRQGRRDVPQGPIAHMLGVCWGTAAPPSLPSHQQAARLRIKWAHRPLLHATVVPITFSAIKRSGVKHQKWVTI